MQSTWACELFRSISSLIDTNGAVLRFPRQIWGVLTTCKTKLWTGKESPVDIHFFIEKVIELQTNALLHICSFHMKLYELINLPDVCPVFASEISRVLEDSTSIASSVAGPASAVVGAVSSAGVVASICTDSWPEFGWGEPALLVQSAVLSRSVRNNKTTD